MPLLSTSDLHTPEELLENAESFINQKTPQSYRAAILEAVVALEAYVEAVVFPALKLSYSEKYVEWLEKKTAMDFDGRLEYLVPLATGRAIDITISPLNAYWNEYKDIRSLRHKIVHKGKKATESDARKAIDVVYKWLSYLGSSIELEVALSQLKKSLESKNQQIAHEADAIKLVDEFFSKSKASTNHLEMIKSDGITNYGIDLLLKFGLHHVTIETKFARQKSLPELVNSSIKQVTRLSRLAGSPESAVIIFHRDLVSSDYDKVLKSPDGDVLVVVIKIP